MDKEGRYLDANAEDTKESYQRVQQLINIAHRLFDKVNRDETLKLDEQIQELMKTGELKPMKPDNIGPYNIESRIVNNLVRRMQRGYDRGIPTNDLDRMIEVAVAYAATDMTEEEISEEITKPETKIDRDKVKIVLTHVREIRGSEKDKEYPNLTIVPRN